MTGAIISRFLRGRAELLIAAQAHTGRPSAGGDQGKPYRALLFPDEIDQFLNDSGVRLLRLGAFPAFNREPDHTTWNVMAVAVAV
jgi:hypothetical protein